MKILLLFWRQKSVYDKSLVSFIFLNIVVVILPSVHSYLFFLVFAVVCSPPPPFPSSGFFLSFFFFSSSSSSFFFFFSFPRLSCLIRLCYVGSGKTNGCVQYVVCPGKRFLLILSVSLFLCTGGGGRGDKIQNDQEFYHPIYMFRLRRLLH